MKTMFYYGLLAEEVYTPTEKIIYSFLVYKSIPLIDGAFTSDGTELDYSLIVDSIESDEFISMYDISQRKLAKVLNISAKSVYNSLEALEFYGDINKKNNTIRVSKRLLQGRYFPLLVDSGLKAELLIFYSYLKHKCDHFGGSIDTFKYKIAQDFCTTKIAVTNMLNRLYRKGFAERLPNGRLKIN